MLKISGLTFRHVVNAVACVKSSTRCLKSGANDESVSGTSKKIAVEIQLTEDLPPIPPNYGWPGDENIHSIYELKETQESFTHGLVSE